MESESIKSDVESLNDLLKGHNLRENDNAERLIIGLVKNTSELHLQRNI